MAKISNELKIGLTVLVATVIAFIGFRIMKDIPLFKTSTTVYTKFDQVYGLLPGNVVNVKGFKIGSVKNMELLPSDSTLVTLNIEEGYSIPKGSIAYLSSSGLLGGKYIEIVKSDSSEMIQNGEYITGVFEQGMMDTFADEGAKLSQDISESIGGIQQLIANLNETLNEKNRDNISMILTDLNRSLSSMSNLIDRRRSDLDTMIVGAKNSMKNLDDISTQNKEKLSVFITNMEATSSELEKLSKGLNETNLTLNEVLRKVNEGEGTLGKMVNDPSLYNNIDSLAVNLNGLIDNIKEEPGKYLKWMRLVEVF